jgi:aryl-alcohol dehydrogenase-like predicted oxidoreductase
MLLEVSCFTATRASRRCRRNGITHVKTPRVLWRNCRKKRSTEGSTRLDGANPFGDSLFTERNWTIVERARRIADESGWSPARSLAWGLSRSGVPSTLMGVSRPEQVLYNKPFTPAMRRAAVFGGSAVVNPFELAHR